MLRNREQFQQVIDFGRRHGHQFDPRYRGLRQLNKVDFRKLNEGDEEAEWMIASIQHSGGGALQELCQQKHGRSLRVDGDAGPATLALVDAPRCNVPDWGPGSGNHIVEDGSLVDEMGELILAAEDISTTPRSIGSGSWNHSCFPEFQEVHVFTVGMNFGSANSAWRSNLAEILRLVSEADFEMGLYRIYIDTSVNPNTIWTPQGWVPAVSILANPVINRSVSHQRIGGSVIGWNQVPNRFTCGMRITGAIDTGYAPSGESGIRRICRLELHEDTHGRGLGHYNATASVPSIMHPSITDGEVSWVGDRVEDIQRRFFGGIRIDPIKFPGWRFGEWA